MALTAITPTYAFTNQFPNITVTGTANKKLLVTLTLGGVNVLDRVIYQMDPDGMAVIRHLGELLEKYFYDQNYDIMYFSKTAALKFESEGETVNRSFPVYFCRSYIGGTKLTPDMVRDRPLSACREKHALFGAKEYLSFVSLNGGDVVAGITYFDNNIIATKESVIHTVPGNDVFTTVDVSPGVIQQKLSNSAKLLYWDVSFSGSVNKIRYWLDKEQSFEPTTFIFQNAFGGVESFVCRGIRKNGLNTERETGVIAGRSILTGQTALRSYTINTGALNEEKQESLISLLSSLSLRVVNGDIAIPVIVDNQTVSLANYRSKLSTAEFTYNHSSRNLTLYKYNKNQGIFDYTFDNTFN